jgi:hypothetical protein
VALGGAIYLVLTALFRVREAADLLGLVGRLLGRLRRGQKL